MKELTVARRAMACEFSTVFPAGTRAAVGAGLAALDEIERLEQRLSVFIEDSELSAVNRAAAAGPVAVAEDLFDLLRFAVILSRATGGAFDCATGALSRAWGFQGGVRRVPCEAARVAALEASGSGRVVLDEGARSVAFRRPGVEFNLGAVGKGYAIDRAVARMVREFGVRSALVQGGQSSMRAIGSWSVAIGDPCGGSMPIARVQLRDGALGTSGTANQFFESGGRRWGHILDPRTGWPATGLGSVSVLARTAAEADALSTAFFVMGAEAVRQFCRRHPAIGAVMAHGDGRVELAGDTSAVEVLR